MQTMRSYRANRPPAPLIAKQLQRRYHEDRILSVTKGLAVKVAGHTLTMRLCESNQTAYMEEKADTNYTAEPNDRAAINIAAELLYQKAKRFLPGWRVLTLAESAKFSCE